MGLTPFVEWIERNPFYIRSVWDARRHKMGGPGVLKLHPDHRRVLEHCLTTDENDELPYTNIIFSTIKKSGKTTIAAAINAWGASVFPDGSELYCLANNQEQSSRILNDIKYHEYVKIDNSLKLRDKPKIYEFEIKYPNTSIVQSLASSYASVAGSRHAMTSYDELWAYRKESDMLLWEEMTPIATVPYSIRLVVTYAGLINESTLLWDLYSRNVGPEEYEDGKGEKIPGLEDLPCWRNGNTFVYWNHEPIMPWQTESYYEEQMNDLRPSAYLRLHENRWVTSHETFIPIEWWDDAIRLEGPIDLMPPEKGNLPSVEV